MKNSLLFMILMTVLFGCGGTYVKLVNNSQNNFTTVDVVSTTSADSKTTFSTVTKGSTTAENKWEYSDLLVVKVVTASPTTTDKTGSVTLTTGKKNTITLTDGTSSSDLLYTVTAE